MENFFLMGEYVDNEAKDITESLGIKEMLYLMQRKLDKLTRNEKIMDRSEN